MLLIQCPILPIYVPNICAPLYPSLSQLYSYNFQDSTFIEHMPTKPAKAGVPHYIRDTFNKKLRQVFKGYLRYKTITSQNVPAKAQIKNFFIS